MEPWANTDRIVCNNYYFASVGAAETLREIGLLFIGVVKTATKLFPMRYLSKIELVNRGDRPGIITEDADGLPSLLAFTWIDRDRRYFIASCSSLTEGQPYIRERWRQVGREDPNADPEKVELHIPQPKIAKKFYSTAARVDQHNRDRQDTQKMKK